MFKIPMLAGDFAGKDVLERVGRELFGDLRIRGLKVMSY